MTFDNDFTGLAVGANGVFLIGVYLDGTHTAIIQCRDLATGAIVWSVYDSDMYNTNSSADGKNAMRCAVDGLAVYCCGQSDSFGWRVQRRSLSNGSVLANIFSQPGSEDCYPANITVNSGGVFVIGYVENVDERGWRIERRDKTLLSVVWAQEYTWEDPSLEGFPLDVCANETHIFIAGYETDPDTLDSIWRVECRLAATGGLVWARNVAGSSSIRAFAVATYGDAVFIMGNNDDGDFLVTKWSAATGFDYLGIDWSDNVMTPQLLTFCSNPGSLAASADGLFALCTEYHNSPPSSRVFQRKKINQTSGGDIWVGNSASYGVYSYAMKIAVYKRGVYLAGMVINNLPNGNAGYVQKVQA